MGEEGSVWPSEQIVIYRFLQFHLATLLVLVFKQDYIRKIYSRIELLSSLFAIQTIAVVVFLVSKSVSLSHSFSIIIRVFW